MRDKIQIPATVLPVWTNREQLVEACEERDISIRREKKNSKTGGKDMQELEEDLRQVCTSVHANEDTPDDDNHVKNVSIDTVKLNMRDRRMRVRANKTDEELRTELTIRIKAERGLLELEAECSCTNFQYLDLDHADNKNLIQDPIRLIFCILHAENRMSETFLTRLFQFCLDTFDSDRAVEKMDEAAAFINSYALRGSSWTYQFEDNSTTELKPIKLTKSRIRKILCKVEWDSGNIQKLIKILVDDDEYELNAGKTAHINSAVEHYVACMHMLSKDKISAREDIYKFQDTADKCGDSILEVWGTRGVTNYFHLLMSGHMRDMMLEWGALLPWSNEGVEALNGVCKLKYHKHTQRGGSAGKNGKAGSKALGMGNWIVRRWMWLCGEADKLFSNYSSEAEPVDEEDDMPISELCGQCGGVYDSDCDDDDDAPISVAFARS
jgi:hypothetical protein